MAQKTLPTPTANEKADEPNVPTLDLEVYGNVNGEKVTALLSVPATLAGARAVYSDVIQYGHMIRSIRQQADSAFKGICKSAKTEDEAINKFFDFETSELSAGRGSGKAAATKEAKRLHDLILSGTLSKEELDEAQSQLIQVLTTAL